MKRWQEYKFDDLVDFPPKVTLSRGEEYPFIEMEDVDPSRRYVFSQQKRKYENSSCSKFEDKDILLARITPCLENGKITQVRLADIKKGFGSTEFFVFRAKKGVTNQSFLFYLAKCDLVWKSAVNSMVGASGRQRADANFLKRIEINIPSLPIQEKIAAILSAYDDLIENNNRRIAILEKMVEELYREWFVRLRFPGYEDVKIVKGVPMGWEEKKVCDLGRVVTGKTPPTANQAYFDGQYPFIKTPDMHNNLFVIKTEETLSDEGIQYQESQTLPSNSICVSCIGTGGVVAITSVISQTNQQINSLILNQNYHREYAFFVLKSMKEMIHLFGYVGATMTNLSKGKFENLKFIMASESIIKEFHNNTENLFNLIHNLQKQTLRLSITRNSLLSRLMGGKIDTENMDIQFPASMQEELAHA